MNRHGVGGSLPCFAGTVRRPRCGWRHSLNQPRDCQKAMAHRLAYSAGVVSDPGQRDHALAKVEAVLLSAEEPLTPRRLARIAELADTGEARRLVTRLNELYLRDGSAFVVEELAGGYQLLTRPELRPWIDRFCQASEEIQLSEPTLETLAIVAYRQPICRADVEAIRGVQVGESLRQLMDKGLVRFAGRDESLGRPYLYGTTKLFLQVFGLRNLHELPLVELLRPPPAPPAEPESEDLADEEASSEDPTADAPPTNGVTDTDNEETTVDDVAEEDAVGEDAPEPHIPETASTDPMAPDDPASDDRLLSS